MSADVQTAAAGIAANSAALERARVPASQRDVVQLTPNEMMEEVDRLRALVAGGCARCGAAIGARA